MTDPKQELMTLTLPRIQWELILNLAIRGGSDLVDAYVRGTEQHDDGCLPAYAKAAKALNDLLHPPVGTDPAAGPESEMVN
jgi:hypothetical protein